MAESCTFPRPAICPFTSLSLAHWFSLKAGDGTVFMPLFRVFAIHHPDGIQEILCAKMSTRESSTSLSPGELSPFALASKVYPGNEEAFGFRFRPGLGSACERNYRLSSEAGPDLFSRHWPATNQCIAAAEVMLSNGKHACRFWL